MISEILQAHKSTLHSNQSGFALVMVLVFMVSMTFFGILALNNSQVEITTSANEKFQTTAFYFADSKSEMNISLLEQNIEFKGFTAFEATNEVYDVWVNPQSLTLYMEDLATKMGNHNIAGRTIPPFGSLVVIAANSADDDGDGQIDEEDELYLNGLLSYRNDPPLVTNTTTQFAFRDAYSPKNLTTFAPTPPGLQTTSSLIYENTTYLKAGGDLETNMGYHQRGVNRGAGAEIAYNMRAHADKETAAQAQIYTQWLHVIK